MLSHDRIGLYRPVARNFDGGVRLERQRHYTILVELKAPKGIGSGITGMECPSKGGATDFEEVI